MGPLRASKREGGPISSLLFKIALEILSREMKEEEEIRSIKIRKGKITVSLFANSMIFYIETPKDSIKRLL